MSEWRDKCAVYSLGESFGTLNMSAEGLIKAYSCTGNRRRQGVICSEGHRHALCPHCLPVVPPQQDRESPQDNQTTQTHVNKATRQLRYSIYSHPCQNPCHSNPRLWDLAVKQTHSTSCNREYMPEPKKMLLNRRA